MRDTVTGQHASDDQTSHQLIAPAGLDRSYSCDVEGNTRVHTLSFSRPWTGGAISLTLTHRLPGALDPANLRLAGIGRTVYRTHHPTARLTIRVDLPRPVARWEAPTVTASEDSTPLPLTTACAAYDVATTPTSHITTVIAPLPRFAFATTWAPEQDGEEKTNATVPAVDRALSRSAPADAGRSARYL